MDKYTINKEIIAIFPIHNDDKFITDTWIIICEINNNKLGKQAGFILTRPLLKSFEIFQEKLEHFSCIGGSRHLDKTLITGRPEVTTVLYCNEAETIFGDNLVEQFTTVKTESVKELLERILKKQKQLKNVTKEYIL